MLSKCLTFVSGCFVRAPCPGPRLRAPLLPPSPTAWPEGEGPSEPTVRERTERFRVRSVDRAPWDWPRHMPRHGLPRVPFPFACRPVSGPSGAARARSSQAPRATARQWSVWRRCRQGGRLALETEIGHLPGVSLGAMLGAGAASRVAPALLIRKESRTG